MIKNVLSNAPLRKRTRPRDLTVFAIPPVDFLIVSHLLNACFIACGNRTNHRNAGSPNKFPDRGGGFFHAAVLSCCATKLFRVVAKIENFLISTISLDSPCKKTLTCPPRLAHACLMTEKQSKNS